MYRDQRDPRLCRFAIPLREFPATGLYPGPIANLLYGGALADKVAGFEIDPFEDDGVTPRAEIRARFNSNLNGNPACLGGRKFYLGLDTNHGNDIDLVTVLLHEFAHGLGFQQFADVTTGARIADLDDVFNVHIFDNTTHKFWPQMTNAERAASAINPRNVVFDGPAVDAAVPGVLAPGTPLLTLLTPAALVGNYQVGPRSSGRCSRRQASQARSFLRSMRRTCTVPSPTDACARSPMAQTSPAASRWSIAARAASPSRSRMRRTPAQSASWSPTTSPAPLPAGWRASIRRSPSRQC